MFSGVWALSLLAAGLSLPGSMLTSFVSIDPPRILVDASHDGGVWWFPQSEQTGFTAAEWHQGQALAYYLRNRGFQVDELPRGDSITEELLNRYDRVIRAGSYGRYAPGELKAYAAFLNRPTSLILIADWLRPGERDELAEMVGIRFAGIAKGTIRAFEAHPITNGMLPLPYIAGSVAIDAAADPSIEVLGRLSDADYADLDGDGTRTAGEPAGGAVMGIRRHPTARVFFLGDLNGIEAVPQPFVTHLIRWAFE